MPPSAFARLADLEANNNIPAHRFVKQAEIKIAQNSRSG